MNISPPPDKHPPKKPGKRKNGFGECQGGRPTVQSLTSPPKHMLIHPSMQ